MFRLLRVSVLSVQVCEDCGRLMVWSDTCWKCG